MAIEILVMIVFWLVAAMLWAAFFSNQALGGHHFGVPTLSFFCALAISLLFAKAFGVSCGNHWPISMIAVGAYLSFIFAGWLLNRRACHPKKSPTEVPS